MASYVQQDRPMAMKTPLGDDALLLVGLNGSEGMSQLFRFHLDALAEKKKEVAFDKLLGQPIIVQLDVTDEEPRYFHGICSRVGQGRSDEDFTAYRLEVVPQFWLLTKRAQSRIFQQKSVPDILKEVLQGLDVSFQIQGTFHPRDYCVQYRETDYNFASRLMEEEGIYYFFKHTKDGHQMVLSNTPQGHPPVPGNSTIIYNESLQGAEDEPGRIYEWTKTQELRSGKFTLWDHCFELPHKHLEADRPTQESVQVGEVTHKLKVTSNDQLEIYDFPGEYAQRFDGVDKGGGDRPEDIEKMFEDNKRTVEIRMQQEAVPAVVIEGAGNCGQLVAGHKFTLNTKREGGPTAECLKADGDYVLTSVTHSASQADYRSNQGEFSYRNSFTCIPAALPYRPPRVTFKPVVEGLQSAVVVGPKGEEIFTDKYGRVKVQFHWDREGKNDAGSSCWVRVAQAWAGKRWGAFFWPRIGQEVIVAFEEGDPDQPIVIGSTYNAQQMPPYLGDGPDSKHKNDNWVSGIKTNSTLGGDGFNELRFCDKKDAEQIFIHAEKNMDVRVKNESMEQVLKHRHLIVGSKDDEVADQRELVYQDKHLHVRQHQVEHIEGNYELLVGKGKRDGGNLDVVIAKDKKEKIDGSQHLTIAKARNVKIGGDHSLTIGGARQEKVGTNYNVEAGATMHIKSGATLVIEAGAQLSLKVGGNFIDINPAGVFIQGTMVMINSGGAAGSGPGAKPTSPESPKEAKPTEPTEADNAKTGSKSC